jgi:fatty acid/phospholipid biosynthesis enzyme
MRNIIVDMSGNDNGTRVIASAIKIFLNKNKDATVYAMGRAEDMLLLKDVKRAVTVNAELTENGKPTNNDFLLAKAGEVYEKVGGDVIISSADKRKVLTFAANHFKKTGLPVLVSQFLADVPKRLPLIGDLGVNSSLTTEQFRTLLSEMQKLANFTFGVAKPTYSLVAPSEDPNDLSEALRDVFDAFQADPAFKGLTDAENLIHGASNIYLVDGMTGEILMKVLGGYYRAYQKMLEDVRQKDFGTKLAFHFGKNAAATLDACLSPKLDLTGQFLLGYDHLLVKPNRATNVSGYFSLMKNVGKYLDFLDGRPLSQED